MFSDMLKSRQELVSTGWGCDIWVVSDTSREGCDCPPHIYMVIHVFTGICDLLGYAVSDKLEAY